MESGHGDYALEKAGPILAFFEDYYNSSYPLSKSGPDAAGRQTGDV